MYNVFVYGSLKQGFHNHKILQAQEFIGRFRTAQASYHMQHLGVYPGVTHQGNSYIQGELYKVNDECLVLLDELEENGKVYQRELIEIADYPERCWMYFLVKQDVAFSEGQNKFQINAERSASHQILAWEVDKS